MPSLLALSCTIGLIQLLNNSKLTKHAIFLIVPIGNQTCHIAIEVFNIIIIYNNYFFIFSFNSDCTHYTSEFWFGEDLR